MKPLLFVTGHAPSYRVGALARLHEREHIEVALFGGRSRHGGAASVGELPFPHRRVRPRSLAVLAASGRYRAVVCPTGGRLALAGTWAGARSARVALILWASLWAHPRSAAHALSYLPLRHLYGSADAVVTYGAHVSDYVRARGASNVHIAPQSVDNEFWREPHSAPPSMSDWPAAAATRFLFVGRPAREKGLHVLIEAWRASGLHAAGSALVTVGAGADHAAGGSGDAAGAGGHRAREAPGAGGRRDERLTEGVLSLPPVPPAELRSLYRASDVLVVPSIPTRTFREPWGLVINEAMNSGLAVIASDAVGAVAGGLVRDGDNGVIVPAGEVSPLAHALRRLAGDARLRERLGAAGAQRVLCFSHEAWAEGFSGALATLGLARGHC